jgi:hypothetical protein
MYKYSDATLNQDRSRNLEMLKMGRFQKKNAFRAYFSNIAIFFFENKTSTFKAYIIGNLNLIYFRVSQSIFYYFMQYKILEL